MKELFLVRHGEPEHHVKGWTGGWTNTSLTELGQKQAQLTGHQLKDLINDCPVGLYSSDLDRATQTAQIIGSILAVNPIIDEALRDLNWGIAKDMPLDEARKLELEKTEPLVDWVPFPEAESWRMLHQRLVPFLEKIHRGRFETVLLVSHANVIEECIFWWLEFSIEKRREISFNTALCSLSHLKLNDWHQKTVAFLNRVDHLQSLST